jgi:hypothetical protein
VETRASLGRLRFEIAFRDRPVEALTESKEELAATQLQDTNEVHLLAALNGTLSQAQEVKMEIADETASQAETPVQQKLRMWQQGLIFAAACAIVISRRPDAIFHPQFWFEDGAVFYAQAYNLGWWSSLFITYEGYFHAIPRIGAGLALLFPLHLAPLVMNLIAVAIQAIPANLLLSRRLSALGSLRFRALLAITYLILPNGWEFNATITWSQWPLALCAFLVLVSAPPQSKPERGLDLCILAASGFSGPFCIFLLPIGTYAQLRNSGRRHWSGVVVLAAVCLVQLGGLLSGGYAGRSHGPLGATPAMLARLLGAQIYVGALIGTNTLSAKGGIGWLVILSVIALAGTVFLAISYLRSPWEMKLLFVLAGAILAASLVSPFVGILGGSTMWEMLAKGVCARYWFFPNLVFVWSILRCFQIRRLVLWIPATVLLYLLCFGVILRWRYLPYVDNSFAEKARGFESAKAGTVFVFDEKPSTWVLRLVKHP